MRREIKMVQQEPVPHLGSAEPLPMLQAVVSTAPSIYQFLALRTHLKTIHKGLHAVFFAVPSQQLCGCAVATHPPLLPYEQGSRGAKTQCKSPLATSHATQPTTVVVASRSSTAQAGSACRVCSPPHQKAHQIALSHLTTPNGWPCPNLAHKPNCTFLCFVAWPWLVSVAS